MQKTILVTGGAGYIGSHACKLLNEKGYIPVTFDNFSTGWPEAVKFGPYVEGDLCNPEDIAKVFKEYKIDTVMHFAACSLVGESVADPKKYWKNNVLGTMNLLEAMRSAGVTDIVFSSTAAVYGDPKIETISENTPLSPTNPYGATKQAIENMLHDYEQAYGIRHIIFRYFNVAGADAEGEIGEHHDPETHLVPLLLQSVQEGKMFTVFGEDYDTADGTCVRDYIHVSDLVDAHIKGVTLLEQGKSGVFNLGTNHGFSVKEILDAVEQVTGAPVMYKVGARRMGDPSHLVSSNKKACTDLQWEPKRSNMHTMITDAWHWHQKEI